MAEAFERYAGVDLLAVLNDRDALASEAARLGLRVSADDHWSDLFSKILSDRIERRLGHGRATVLIDYPASEAALARRKPEDPRLAERFELYGCGVELANAFGELTDPVEQRRRFEADMREREKIYGDAYPIDEDLLDALAVMPRGQRHRAGPRPSGDAGDGRGTYRAGALGAGGAAMTTFRGKTLTRPDELIAAGFAEPSQAAALAEVAALYSVAVPPGVSALIERPDDPIGRQFLPDAAELRHLPQERADPIGDDAHEVAKGLIHRYPDRALLKLTSVCPVYCRFCFRRARVGAGTPGLLDEAALDAAFAYLARASGDLGADRHRRRSARGVAPPPRRLFGTAAPARPRKNPALPFPRARA